MGQTVRIVPRQDHDGILSFEEGIEAVYEGFADREAYTTTVIDEPRHRLLDPETGMGIYNHFGISPSAGVGGALIHSHQVRSDTKRQEFGNEGEAVYVLYDSESSHLRAILIGEFGGKEYPPLGMMAYGTALETAVGTDVLAREDSTDLGILGSGRQAQNHLVAFENVRDVETVRVYSPTVEHREAFKRTMSNVVDAEIEVVESTADAIREMDIILCASNASSPVFDGELLEPGQHVSTIVGADIELVEAGRAPELRREIDNATIEAADTYVANSVAQGRQNKQGDLYLPVRDGVIEWSDIVSLPDVIGGDHPGRESESDITVYKQNSIQGVTQMALANKVMERIEENDLGIELAVSNPRRKDPFADA